MKYTVKNIGIGCLIIIFFTLIIIKMHSSLTLFGDDLANINKHWDSVVSIFKFYWGWNGRVTTDVLGNLLLHHFAIWKSLNICACVVLVVLFIRIIDATNAFYYFLACILFLLLPFDKYFSSAGWIFTTTNYFYPAIGFLFLALILIKQLQNKKILTLDYLLAVLGVMYLGFHTQFIIVAISMTSIFFLYSIVKKENKKTILTMTFFLAHTIMLFLVMWFSPGFQRRKTDPTEMMLYLPQYADWSFFDKLFRGFTSTVANVFFVDNIYVVLLCLGYFALGIQKKKNIKITFLSAIPLVIMSGFRLLGFDKFYNCTYGLPDISTEQINIYSVLAVGGSVIAILLFLFLPIWLVDNIDIKVTVPAVLLSGAFSREIMGFSPTIYASSFRTFVPLYICLMLVILLLVKEIYTNSDNKKYIMYSTMAVTVTAWMHM